MDLILSDDGEPESDGELDEPMCPGSDEEFDLDTEDQFSFNQRYKKNRHNKIDNNTACNYNSDEESNSEEGNEVDSNNCESPGAAAHTYKYSMLVCAYVHT